MKQPYLLTALILCAAIAALALRLPRLDVRPLHGDEANQAHKAGRLLEGHGYAYDPYEHHGPTLYYLTLPIAWLQGADTFAETNEATYRLVPVLFGIALVLLPFALTRELGLGGAFAIALLTAVSPAMAYYSRYYIQETPLVFFTFATIVCGWRYVARPSVRWAALAGLALGCMHATKETCIVAWACMLLAGVVSWRFAPAGPAEGRRPRASHAALCLGVALLVSVAFFTSFFTHARGPLDSILTYTHYLARSGGEGTGGLHDKPFHYYVQMLLYTKRGGGRFWSEAPILLFAVAGFMASIRALLSGDSNARLRPGEREAPSEPKRVPDWAGEGEAPSEPLRSNRDTSGSAARLRRKAPAARLVLFLAVYALAMTLAYSAIPYKTPWNMLSLLHALIVVAGIGAAWLWNLARPAFARALLALGLALSVLHLAEESCRANFRYPADPRNPYVYAHTSSAFMRLIETVQGLDRAKPDAKPLRILVIDPRADYWPLPFYLRTFEQVGYYVEPPALIEADVLIVSKAGDVLLPEETKTAYVSEMNGLRPGVLLRTYIRRELWEAYMATRR